MAREQVVFTYCDVHLTDKDEKVPAQSYSWNKQQVDLCDDCGAPLVAAQTLFDTYGATGKRTRARKPQSGEVDPQTCPECGTEAKNRNALLTHCRARHGMTLGEILAKQEGEKLPYSCSVCGKGFSTPQGAGAHRARSHPGEESASG